MAMSAFNLQRGEWNPVDVIDDNRSIIYKLQNSISKVTIVGKLFNNPAKPSCSAEALRAAFLEEQNWHTMLEHRNIISFYGSAMDQNLIYMEYAENGDLLEHMDRTPVYLLESKLRRYYKHVIAGLSYMHKKGIAHGDIKPENLLVCKDDTVKICDFGHSRYFVDGVRVTVEKRYGSLRYMAPEIFHQVPHCPAQTDIWSVGAILLFLIGDYHWDKPDTSDFSFSFFFRKAYNVKPWSTLPAAVRPLIEGILQQNPDERLSLRQIEQSLWFSQS